MATQTHDIWELVLKDVKKTVSHANFHTLFSQATLLSLQDGVATISGTSPMLVDLLQKRFGEIIQTSLEKHAGQKVSIVFVIKGIPKKKNVTAEEGPLFTPENKQETSKPTLPRVRADYTFETLAVSQSNQLAFVSAQTVAKNLGHSYNPLFIYGPVGVGKTHLMQAIANEVFRKDQQTKVIYITSEEFTNEVVEAIRSNDTARMKRRFRSINLLIIDDIQFIAGKDRVQEELFHTFNALIDKGSQIVLSSDRPPSEIKKLEKRLSSRFAGGLSVDIEAPDFELRSAIVLIKAKKYGVDLSIDVAKTIAEKQEDIRSLEGSLLRVITQATTKHQEITPEVATSALSSQGGSEPKRVIHPDDVIKQVCSFYNFRPTQLKGPKRDASLVKSRQVTMFLLKNALDMTYVEIGNFLGGRDHTTVIHGVEKIGKLLPQDEKLHEEILGITRSFGGQLSQN